MRTRFQLHGKSSRATYDESIHVFGLWSIGKIHSAAGKSGKYVYE